MSETGSLLRPALVVAVVMVLAAVVTGTVGGIVVLPIGAAIAALGIPYTAVALVLWVLRRVLVTPLPPDDRDPVEGAYDRRAQAFGLFSQRASLVLAVVLLALLGITGIATAGSPSGAFGGGFPVGLLAGAVTAGAVLAIALNMPQLYLGRLIALERHAVATRTGAWRRIVAAWILSPLMWVAYSTCSAAVLGSLLLS